jgi:hypothetical protein
VLDLPQVYDEQCFPRTRGRPSRRLLGVPKCAGRIRGIASGPSQLTSLNKTVFHQRAGLGLCHFRHRRLEKGSAMTHIQVYLLIAPVALLLLVSATCWRRANHEPPSRARPSTASARFAPHLDTVTSDDPCRVIASFRLPTSWRSIQKPEGRRVVSCGWSDLNLEPETADAIGN